jgi:TIR domain-containing protein
VVSLVQRKGGIFIGYRRDQVATAGRLSDQLSKHFGEDRVFWDVATITSGDDWAKRIISEVSKCGVMLVLIGPDWLGSTRITRRKRIGQPDDWVRVEIETALRQGIWMIPVLLDGVEMPKAGTLPQSLRPLTRRQAFALSHISFRHQVGLLIQAVERGYEVPQEEWRLDLQSHEGSSHTFLLSSGSTEHLIVINFTNWGKSFIYVDGQEVATGITSAGIAGQEITLESLSREFGPVATIKLETLNPATSYLDNRLTCFRIILEMDDQVLEYKTEEYDRALERRQRNEQLIGQASAAVKNFFNNQAVVDGIMSGISNALKDALKGRRS